MVYAITAPIYPSAMDRTNTSFPDFNSKSDNFAVNTRYTSLNIPSIELDLRLEGVKQGIWIEREDIEGNFVVAGHRFEYLNPFRSPLYRLDEVKVGDIVILEYMGSVYRYEVVKKFIVSAKDTWIRDRYQFQAITIYTCTPLYNPVNRLVVVGKVSSIE